MNELRLVVEPLQAEYFVDTEIPVRILLLNDGNDPITVNDRFAVSSASGAGELSFSIIDSSGDRLPFGARVNLGRAGKDHVATIAPADFVRTTIDLADYFDLGEPGTYRVSARYRSVGDGEVIDDDSAPPRVWTGTVESDEMSINLQ